MANNLVIIGTTLVAHVVVQKGITAAKLMDDFFGTDACCENTNVDLDHAAELCNKSKTELSELIEKLNKLPDEIKENSVIGKITAQKGMPAARLMDEFFCVNSCCPRTTLELGYAAKLLEKEKVLPSLITKLNEMPDIR